MTVMTVSFLNTENTQGEVNFQRGGSRGLLSIYKMSSRHPSGDASEAAGYTSVELSGEVKAHMKI